MSAVPLQPTTDLEQGKGGQGVVSQPSEGSFPKEYYVLYAFSLFIVAVGTWAFFLPFAKTSIVGTMCGVGGMVVGAFLILNADLLVTYLRLMREMQRFKANNKHFTGCLKEQKKKICQLKQTKKALEVLDEHCHNKVDNLQGKLEEMAHNARDRVRRNIVNVLTFAHPKSDIKAGDDLDQVMRMFTNMYIRAFPAIQERFAELRKGLEASARWQRNQTMSVDRFKFIVVPALFEDISSIQELVRNKIDEESDHQAYLHQAADMNTSPTEAPEDTRLSQTSKGAAAAGDDADWTDALDFAEGKKEEGKEVPPPKDDPWADAIAFAGRS